MSTNRNDVVLARHAAAQLEDAACGGRRELWDAAESVIAISPSRAATVSAAAPLLRICWSECLVRDACRQWAEIDRYTGVAGGQILAEGRTRNIRDRAFVA